MCFGPVSITSITFLQNVSTSAAHSRKIGRKGELWTSLSGGDVLTQPFCRLKFGFLRILTIRRPLLHNFTQTRTLSTRSSSLTIPWSSLEPNKSWRVWDLIGRLASNWRAAGASSGVMGGTAGGMSRGVSYFNGSFNITTSLLLPRYVHILIKFSKFMWL